MSEPNSKASNQFASTGRSSKGESWVWLTAAGLTLGIVMVVFLLGLIVVRGVSSFWPRQIQVLEVVRDDQTQIMAGYIAKRSERRDQESRLIDQVQIFRGNAEEYADPYVYLNERDIKSREVPAGWMMLERTDDGPGILKSVALVTPNGRIDAGDEGFEDALKKMVELNHEVREESRRIKRKLIGANSRELRDIDIAEKVGDMDAEEAAKRRAELMEEGGRLNAKVALEEERMAGYQYIGATAEGKEMILSGDTILNAFQPNDTGLLGRLFEMLRRMWKFLIEDPRRSNAEGGVYPAIFGTVVMTLAMTFFVTPFGVIAAIYLREYAKQGTMVRVVRICVNNLAGVPSIVFGVFGLAFFVYFVGAEIDQMFFADKLETQNEPTFGAPGILWASLTLALLTLPVLIVATEEALSAVPRGVREAALACGASKWQTIQRIVIPASLPGIMTGIILAMARGAGEVAPLMLVGAVKMAHSLPIDDVAPYVHPERQFMHLGFHIYDLGFKSSNADAAEPMVYATALLLILLVMVLNLAAIIIRNRLKKKFAVSHF